MTDRIEEDKTFDEAIEEGEETALVVAPEGPGKLLEMAVQQDLDMDKLERLVAMKERWDAQEARKAFYEALSKFQKLVPVLEKRSKVSFGTTKYSFAPLSDIKDGVQGSLSQCGLSYHWKFADNEGQIDVTCIVTHLSGHSEKTTMTAPADKSGSKNPVQERASTITYLQRYTLIGALGLTTANQDDDGRKGEVSGPTPAEAAENLPPVPEGTDTKAPKPEPTGKTDFEKQKQLLDLLKEICGTDNVTALTDELEALTTFESAGEQVEGERSLQNLKGKRLNVAIGKAKAKLGHLTPKDELLKLLTDPLLSKVLEPKIIRQYIKDSNDGRHKEQWHLEQLPIVRGYIADAEKENR